MSEALNGREALERHNEDYGLIDRARAERLSCFLDRIIDFTEEGSSPPAYKFGVASECREFKGLLADMRPNVFWSATPFPLALSGVKFDIRRDVFKREDITNSGGAGDVYTVAIERIFHMNGKGEDPYYSRAFKLIIPEDPTQDDVRLMLRLLPLVAVDPVYGKPSQLRENPAYYQADSILYGSFYEWQPGTIYDANQLTRELVLIEAEASSRNNPSNTLN